MNDDKKETVEKKPVYKPPQAMRLSEDDAGKGACGPGSGDADCNGDGTGAGVCFFNGNGA